MSNAHPEQPSAGSGRAPASGHGRFAEIVVEAALDCVIGMDADGLVVAFNPAAETTFGYRRSEALGRSVAELLADLGYEPRTVAVERNGRILPRERFAETPLTEGDRLELVRFVQGG